MVFLSLPRCLRITYVKETKNPDRFWKKRKIFRMSAHFRGRKQNCYTLAVQYVRRALRTSTYERKRKHVDIKELQMARLNAACEEHGFNFNLMRESLVRSDIHLNKTVLCDLAIWEPRTFKCLTNFAWNVAKNEGLNGIDSLGNPPEGVILRPLYIKK